YRKKQLKELSVGEVAPLKKKDLKSVHFYDVNEKLRLTAKVEILSNEQPFYMPSFVGAPQEFVRYAKLHFQINGQEYSLTAYKNLRLALLPNADRKSTRLNSSHVKISYAVFCLKKQMHRTSRRS